MKSATAAGSGPEERLSLRKRLARRLFGQPRSLRDPRLFRRMALIPLLAWIGLGADGLSSSAYGPEQAFRVLGRHTSLAIALAVATGLTVLVISAAYSRIIENFPNGGGGYIVASHLLGPRAGVLSGSALLVDYVLTIAVSIASCGDALFSFLPAASHAYKVPVEALLIAVLIVLNIRGIKQAILVLTPIFLLFFLTHVFLIGYGIISRLPELGAAASAARQDFRTGLATLGGLGMLGLFFRAYSLGGGTYTGIEAVSNGLSAMKEPHAQSGRRTMRYMAWSLALAASGLLFCYLLSGAVPAAGRTLNAVLAGNLFGQWRIGPLLALVTILSEGALLLVAAQTGFVDGPRVMANMANDSWLPHRFSALSERLTMRNGITLMGLASLLVLVASRGRVSFLVVMYSINVFLTFSLSNLGMSRHSLRVRSKDPAWLRHLALSLTGLALCLTILIITALEKFGHGGWITLAVTAAVVGVCLAVKRRYVRVYRIKAQYDKVLKSLPRGGSSLAGPPNPRDMTAIQLVRDFDGFGLHTMITILHSFPGIYKNMIFCSVAVADSGIFKGRQGLPRLQESTRKMLARYVRLARRLGFRAQGRMAVGTDVVETATQLCLGAAADFPKSMVFVGQVVFTEDKLVHRILHNQTGFAIQKNLQGRGVGSVALPIKLEA